MLLVLISAEHAQICVPLKHLWMQCACWPIQWRGQWVSTGLAAGRHAWLHSLVAVRVSGWAAAGLCVASCEWPGRWLVVSQWLSRKARWQRVRARPWADGLGKWCGAEAGDGGIVTLGSAVTLPTLGHMFLGSCASLWVSQMAHPKGQRLDCWDCWTVENRRCWCAGLLWWWREDGEPDRTHLVAP